MKPLELLQSWWSKASPVLRASVIAGTAALVALGLFLSQRPGEQRYEVLHSDLAPDEAGRIQDELRKRKVTFRTEGSGRILVPHGMAEELRNDLASEGLGPGQGDGYRLLDKNSLLNNSFQNRINLKRAKEGEIAKNLLVDDALAGARVHLATPDNSIFAKDREPVKAAVWLILKPGRRLSRGQVDSVVASVANGVEGLRPENVAVTDSSGRLLTEPSDESSRAASRAVALTQDFELRTERRLVELLEPLVGPGRVLARVSAELDTSEVEATEETYDGDQATVQREQKLTENTSQETRSPTGAAGTPGNVPAAVPSPPGLAGSNNASNRSTVQVDYAIPRVVKHVKRPFGSVRRLSVAVLVDSGAASTPSGAAGADGGVNAETPPEIEQRPSLARIDELVKKAVGFDASRGDQLEILSTPFAPPPEPVTLAAPAPAPVETPYYRWAAAGAGVLLVLLAVLVYWLRGRKARKQRALEEARAREEAALVEQEKVEEEEPKPVTLEDRVRDLAEENVPLTVKMIRDWLTEPGKG